MRLIPRQSITCFISVVPEQYNSKCPRFHNVAMIQDVPNILMVICAKHNRDLFTDKYISFCL